jgi:hypothetical protein
MTGASSGTTLAYFLPARTEELVFRTQRYRVQKTMIAMQAPTTWRACTSASAAETMDVGAKTPE